MEIPHQIYKIDINNTNEPLTRMIASVNDKGVRYVDVELWADSQKVVLSANCVATAAFVTDGCLINDNIECTIKDDFTTVVVPIDNSKIKSKSGVMFVEITIIDESGNILTPPFAFKVRMKKSITEDACISEKSYGTVAEILKEVAAARGNYDSLNNRINSKIDDVTGAVKTDNIAKNAVTSDKITPDAVETINIADNAVTADKIADKAVTNGKIANGAITATKIAVGAVSGNNIAQGQINAGHLQSGAVTSNKLADEVKATINGKADKSTTYTKTEVNNALSSKLDNAEGSVTRDNIDTNAVGTDEIDSGAVETINIADNAVTADKIADKAVTNGKIANGAITATKIAVGAVSGNNIAQGQINTGHLQNGAVTVDKIDSAVMTTINNKYDSSNVETGNGVLTPYNENMSNKINSASFSYQRNGSYVTVSVYIDFKAFTVDNTGVNIMLLGLPYVCKNAVNPRELCVTTLKRQMIYAVTANTSNLTLLFINTGAFDVNEKLSFTVTYKIS